MRSGGGATARTLAEHKSGKPFNWFRHEKLLVGSVSDVKRELARWHEDEAQLAAQCVQLAKELGYAKAAKQLNVSTSFVYGRVKQLGQTKEVSRARGRMSLQDLEWAADVLGVCVATVNNMRRDGRLPKAFTQEDVLRLRKAWALVRYDAAADEASRWDPCWRRCMVCLDFFRIKRSWVLQGRGWTCSNKCSGEWRSYKTPRITVIKVKAKRRRCVPRMFYGGFCESCGSAFVYRQPKSVCLVCSAKQSKRASRDRRKALERGAVKIERVFRRKVYERDRWRCHICGEKISQHLQAPDPGSATLDHIHPLSLGGSHTYDNVKAAHYGCNSARGNRDEFQMRMPVAA
jgi:5-methylcytosine-specific restriction endonuclease McrA